MSVKNQHYVWRNYLAAWSSGEREARKRRIYILRKHPRGSQPHIEHALLTNVASEKFFYDISGYKTIDQEIMKQFIDYLQRRDPVKLEIDFHILNEAISTRDFLENNVMSLNENIDNVHCFLERLKKGDLSFYRDSTAQQIINLLKAQMEKSLLGDSTDYSDEELFEEFLRGMAALQSETDLKFEFNRFFWMQYFRSKKMHENQEKVIDEFKHVANLPQLDNAFYVNLMLIFVALKVALNVTQNMYSCLRLYKNHTDTPFITADTPIVNLDYSDVKNQGVDSRMYYPVSPNTAVILQTGYVVMENKVHDIYQEDVSIVNEFNRKIHNQASNETYASDEQVLYNM